MGGAVMELVAKGSQDIFLTGNPSVSYFRNVYKRHTNFAMESIQQSINGEANFGKKIECVISRSGDLLTGIVIEIDLPKLEGKRNKFFFLGPKNDWQKILDNQISKNIEEEFEKEMKELGYL